MGIGFSNGKDLLDHRPVQEDIGRDTITIHSGNTKTRRTRVIPIAPGLRQWLKHVPLPYKDYEGLKSSYQRARIKAEMPWVNFHDLRHSCASILMAKGADLKLSQQPDALKRAFG